MTYDFYLSRLREFKTKMEMHEDSDLWKSLVSEEREELLKELIDVVYVSAGLATCPIERTQYSRIDGKPYKYKEERYMSQCGKDAIEYGEKAFGKENFAVAFDRVHQSNLSKLDDDGKPIRREDGKIIKGPNYKPPYLKDLI